MIKKSTLFLIILLAIFFTSTLILLFLNFNQKFHPSQITNITPTQTETPPIDPTADWKTYENKKLAFSFRYPNYLRLEESYNFANLPGKWGLTIWNNDKVFFLVDEHNYNGYFDEVSKSTIKFGNINYIYFNEPGEVYGTYNYDIDKKIEFITFTKDLHLTDSQFTQILSTFKFTNPVSTQTPTTTINKVKILDTSSWIEYSCNLISYKLPSNYTQKCHVGTDGIQDEIFYGEDGKYGGFSIRVKKYDGGSRRQNWIDTIQATPAEVSKYVRFQESLFGTVSGLDVFASGGWWQGGYASSILIAQGKTIVYIYGGRNYNEVTGKITRWDISDTIASTIKFL